MENINCYIFAFATFGHPNDFRQTPFKYGNPEIAKQVKVFDLSNAIKVFPNSTIYSIRKERIGKSKLISYAIYTFAQEQASKRDGTFIGSSIILENKITNEEYVINCLNEFHQKLTENNLNNGILKVNHSKDFIPITKLSDFEKIKNPEKEITFLNFNNNNNNLVVYCDISNVKLASLFNKSIDLLNVYDTIYFTDSKEVGEFVHQKGIFKLIQNVGEKRDFEKEINSLIEERKRKREQSISEFERELQRINEDKNQTIQEFKNQIEQSERTHLENDRKLKESKEDIKKIDQFYDDFLNKTKNLINQLRHNNGKLEEVKQIHNNNKVLFNSGISDLKRPNYTTSISKPKAKGKLNVEQPIPNSNILQDQTKFGIYPESTRNKIDFFKVATLIFGALLIFTWVYIYLAGSENSEYNDEQNQNNFKSHLFTEPNSKLSEKDCKIVSTKINYEYKLDTIVDIIFKLNPNDIQFTYEKYREKYSTLLYNENENCFEIIDNDTVFKKDSIKNIPSFKK